MDDISCERNFFGIEEDSTTPYNYHKRPKYSSKFSQLFEEIEQESITLMKKVTKSANDSPFTLAVFLLSIAWFRSWQRKKLSKDKDCNDDDGSANIIENDTIGPRGASALKKTTSYWVGFMECLRNPCDPNTNPTGHIALCLAENKLVQEALALRLMQQGTAITAFSDSVAYCYSGFLGLPSARIAAASFIEKRFWRKSSVYNTAGLTNSEYKTLEMMEDKTISPDNVAFGSGVGSLLNHLFFIIAQKGDVVLIPAPYYAAFEYDAKAIAGCIPFPVYQDNPMLGPSQKDLDNAFNLAKAKGRNVKMLLLTNPNDPLGVVYKPQVVSNAITWARSHDIHTIVDEIFALTVHKPDTDPDRFHSVIEILDNDLGNDVHFLWGFSKDFGASGFRLAILYSQNVRLLQALANLNIFSGVSNPMQLIAAEIMSDDGFMDTFLNDARTQLIWSYRLCVSKLEEMVVPYVPATAGLFVYVDFSSLLPQQTFEGERAFAALIQNVARIVMTPGESQRDCKPGMFRLCYAWVTFDVLKIAMERLSYMVLQIRRHSWQGIDGMDWGDEVIKQIYPTLLTIKDLGSKNNGSKYLRVDSFYAFDAEPSQILPLPLVANNSLFSMSVPHAMVLVIPTK